MEALAGADDDCRPERFTLANRGRCLRKILRQRQHLLSKKFRVLIPHPFKVPIDLIAELLSGTTERPPEPEAFDLAEEKNGRTDPERQDDEPRPSTTRRNFGRPRAGIIVRLEPGRHERKRRSPGRRQPSEAGTLSMFQRIRGIQLAGRYYRFSPEPSFLCQALNSALHTLLQVKHGVPKTLGFRQFAPSGAR